MKTRKTAGTSMEIALSKICGDKDVITKISSQDEKVRREYSNRTKQNDRIPLSKLSISELTNCLSGGEYPRFYNHMTCTEIKRYVSKKTWNTYYKFTIERNPFDKIVSFYYWRGGSKKYNDIYDFLTNGGLSKFKGFDMYSINGSVAVDKIYRYENITDICDHISKKLKLEKPFTLPEYKAKSHTRKTKDYKDILDEKSIELIKDIFAREISLLDYKY